MELKEEISKRKKEGWFDVSFAIEAMGVTSEVVEESLRKHVEKLSKVRNLFVYEKDFKIVQKIKNPIRTDAERTDAQSASSDDASSHSDDNDAYSQVVTLKFFVHDLTTLLVVVMTYGPSSIEILGPDKKEVRMGEIQDISNLLATIVHQFAAAGVGGIVITPEGKK